jgi:hypothetical protein
VRVSPPRLDSELLMALFFVPVLVVFTVSGGWYMGLALVGIYGAVTVVSDLLGGRGYVRVTEASQPALHALVDTVAARLGLRRPRRVRLVAEAKVVAHVSIRRRELRIGQALLPCVTEAELAALIGAELSLLAQRRAWRAVRMRAVWVDVGERMTDDEERTPKDLNRWRALAPFGAAVIAEADRAAATAAGGDEVAARAIVLADLAGLAHYLYLTECGPPPGKRRYAILDLDDGWRRHLDHGVRDTWWDKRSVEDLAPLHPGLAGTLAVLAPPERLTLAAGAVRIAPIPEKQRRRLARDLHPHSREGVTWTTFERAPAQWWLDRAAADAAAVCASAAAWADGPITDVFTAVGALARGVGRLDPTAPMSAEQVDDVLDGAALLIEHALLDRGWRLRHPAVRGVLVGPAGTVVDRDAMAVAVNDPTVLRGWLDER